MRHTIRAGLGVAAATVALALANSALAAMSPHLDVGTGMQSSTLKLGARLGQADDWLGRLQIFVPAGYKVAPTGGTATVQAVETQIGPSTRSGHLSRARRATRSTRRQASRRSRRPGCRAAS
jgi:hypothetical protein